MTPQKDTCGVTVSGQRYRPTDLSFIQVLYIHFISPIRGST